MSSSDERNGPAGTNKGKSKSELDAIEALIKSGKTKHEAQNEAMSKDKSKPFKPVPKA